MNVYEGYVQQNETDKSLKPIRISQPSETSLTMKI